MAVKQALILTSVASMIDQFMMPNIELLIDMGYKVHVACNFIEGNTCTDKQISILKNKFVKLNVSYHQIDFKRNIRKLLKNRRAYSQVYNLMKKENYEFVHCHSPIGGVCGRIAGKATNTRVIYTAHGFHFYKGAPLKNWLIYYTVEKWCSKMTDVLITINQEDYDLAKRKMKAKKVIYIPGVGVDLNMFSQSDIHGRGYKNIDRFCIRNKLRQEIGCREQDILLLSVGELNNNKNHELVIKSLAQIDGLLGISDANGIARNKCIHYAIAGKGEKREYLMQLSKSFALDDRIHFIGFTSEIADWYNAADVFVFPSYREGLSVSLMEAMASGLPCVVSEIRGNTDLIDSDGGVLFKAGSVDECREAIQKILILDMAKMGTHNQNKILSFSVNVVRKLLEAQYRNN